jgi:rRNA maturation endonuclease Nob1
MPLPKSVVCTSCKKTDPEGWKRCPYCGHDELRKIVRSGAFWRRMSI